VSGEADPVANPVKALALTIFQEVEQRPQTAWKRFIRERPLSTVQRASTIQFDRPDADERLSQLFEVLLSPELERLNSITVQLDHSKETLMASFKFPCMCIRCGRFIKRRVMARRFSIV
jgi:hypothetical protein